MIWFVNNNAGACASACDGRLTHPFTTLAAFNGINNGRGTTRRTTTTYSFTRAPRITAGRRRCGTGKS
jgi:hypothetical protein